jgi:HEAT repeat protein
MALALLMTFAVTRSCQAIDWTAFDNPKAVFLTDPFAKLIAELTEPQKTAAVKRLHESLKSTEGEIRRRAALTLGELGVATGVPTMIADLGTATGRDRDNVVVALRVLKDRRAIPVLRTALKDKSPYVRSIAVAALGELKAGEAYAEIVALTKDKEIQGNEKNGKQLNCIRITPADLACYSLGALGDTRAVPVLIELLRDPSLKTSARQGLEALTKQKLGDDPEKWAAWWKHQDR